MWSNIKNLLTFIKLGLFLLAIVLSIANINERFNSNKTTSTSYIADLASVDFPLKISVLINPGFKFKELDHVSVVSANIIIPILVGPGTHQRAGTLEIWQVWFLMPWVKNTETYSTVCVWSSVKIAAKSDPKKWKWSTESVQKILNWSHVPPI